MNKYKTEDYFSVRERRTGRKICDCGDFEDARMIMYMDAPNREIVKNKTLMSPVIDVVMPKALPTTNISVSNAQENISHLKQLGQIKLPQGQQEPFNVRV
jgi:hypothetical protein